MAYTAGPYDSGHLYLQWGGKLPGGETWSNGLRFADIDPANPSTEVIWPTMHEAAKTAIQTFHTSLTSYISSEAKLSFVKLNLITMQGVYQQDATNEIIVADVPGGDSGLPNHPNQVTLAVSLLTGFSRGPAHRGRIFLPLPNLAMEATGTIAAAFATNIGNNMDTLLASLNALNANYKVAVFSRKLGAPAHRLVTGVEVGRVLDTQRRRRRSLVEAYV